MTPVLRVNVTLTSPTDPRIYLAAERTFLAWLRTGVALMGFGFVVARFGLFLREMAETTAPGKFHDPGFSLPVGLALVVLGAVVNVLAAIRHHRNLRAIDLGQFRQQFGSSLALTIAALLAMIGMGVTIYLAML